jgi:cytochrome P450
MTRDEEAYPDAESFKPERFIKKGTINKEIRDPREIAFGFGRRCVFFRFHANCCLPTMLILLSSGTVEFVLAATWRSAPSG